MKRVVILLVLLNIIIFAYFQLPDASSSSVSQDLPDLHPEKLKLLSDKDLQALQIVSDGAEAPPVAKE